MMYYMVYLLDFLHTGNFSTNWVTAHLLLGSNGVIVIKEFQSQLAMMLLMFMEGYTNLDLIVKLKAG